MVSKVLKAKMKINSITVMLTGRSAGSVMCRNCCQADAPSMRAASYSTAGTLCSPATSRIIANGAKLHAVAGQCRVEQPVGAVEHPAPQVRAHDGRQDPGEQQQRPHEVATGELAQEQQREREPARVAQRDGADGVDQRQPQRLPELGAAE